MTVIGTGTPVNRPPASAAPTAPRGLSLSDRRVQLGAAAAAVIAAALLLRGGSASASQLAEDTSRGTSTADTTATDIESAISSALSDVYGRLDDISQGLTKTPQEQLPANPAQGQWTPTNHVPTSSTASTAKPKTSTPTKTSTYRIRSGDTLGKIASRNKISLGRLKQLNPGLFNRAHKGGNLVKPGEVVKLR